MPAEWRHGTARAADGRRRFRVWAPRATAVSLRLSGPGGSVLPMEAVGAGYYEAVADGAGAGTRYAFRIDGRELPDPASRAQPEGIHGPSEVVEAEFEWHDAEWSGLPLEDFVLYELHAGTYTTEGTFDAVIPHLDGLKELGVTAIELMPVAQFPGERNWGYDGVYPFAAQNSYGGAAGLKRLVDACHARGLAVVLDVVYNHLGPEGNYLAVYGEYFTEKHRTPWGPALNFDGPGSDEVRRFFVENALYWIGECHIDALRLDAVHAIHDESASPFLAELGEAVRGEGERLGRRVYTIAESDSNDNRMVRPRAAGGLGVDAQWSDDFHHALHALLTGERSGYYRDFGGLEYLAKAYLEGFVYSGQYSAHRRRRHGSSSRDIPARRMVVCSQNHDQVGNRMLGERLASLVSYEQLKLAAGAVLLGPYVPLLFMGEEYGETAPFLYFVSHGEGGLIEAVRRGRKRDFAAFAWQGEPPDAQDAATFRRSKLNHGLKQRAENRTLLGFYRRLLELRRKVAALASPDKDCLEATALAGEQVLCLRRWSGGDEAVVLLCFAPVKTSVMPPVAGGAWRKLLDSSDPEWLGPGGSPERWTAGAGVPLKLNANSILVYGREAGSVTPSGAE